MTFRVPALLAAVALLAACVADEPADPPAEADQPGVTPSPTSSPEPTGAADATEPADAAQRVGAELLVDGLHVPNDLADLGDGRLLISDQIGAILVWSDGDLLEEPFLDLRDRVIHPTRNRQEVGLAGFAPHPDFHDNGTIYAFFTEPPEEGSRATRVDVLAEFTVSADDPNTIDQATERELLRLEQPSPSHVGGHLAFGSDGYLYLGLGDAGRAELAQDPETLQGSIIRIDVDDGDPYGIPADNPFASGGGAAEIFSYGFRNPFRVTWDDELGLIITEPMFTSKDQEVNVAVEGANFGYPDVHPQLPGSSCYASATSVDPLPECVTGPDGTELQAPLVEFPGQIASGAVTYRGTAIPELAGKVLAAEWTGQLHAATPGGPVARWLTEPVELEMPDELAWPSHYLWTLDADADGEVYLFVVSRSFREDAGAVYRLTPPLTASS